MQYSKTNLLSLEEKLCIDHFSYIAYFYFAILRYSMYQIRDGGAVL